MAEPQNFKNHTRLNPIFHMVAGIPLIGYFVWSIYRVWSSGATAESLAGFVLAFGVLALFFAVRNQVLTVQDRLIRLEMRLRLRHVLPSAMHPQIEALTIPQLVALRFASDGELPALTAQVIAGECPTPKDIKMRVKEWQADYQRA